MTLDEVNAASVPELVTALGAVFEHAPWVAEQAAAQRPFATVAALHEAMTAAVQGAPEATQLEFLRGHPELGGTAARGGQMAAHSIAEQAALGLERLADDRAGEIQALNAEYSARFGFPFILCVSSAYRAPRSWRTSRSRLNNTRATRRWHTALAEIRLITRLRLVALVDGPGKPVTTGVAVDPCAGHGRRAKPGAGIPVVLYEIDGEQAIKLNGGGHQP